MHAIEFFAVPSSSSSSSFERLKCVKSMVTIIFSASIYVYTASVSDFYSDRNGTTSSVSLSVCVCVCTRVQIFCFILNGSNVCINLNDLLWIKCKMHRMKHVRTHMNQRTWSKKMRSKVICIWCVLCKTKAYFSPFETYFFCTHKRKKEKEKCLTKDADYHRKCK